MSMTVKLFAATPEEIAGVGTTLAGVRAFVNNRTEHARYRFSLDKDWHAVHYVLTGTANGGEPPLSWAVFGRHVLRDVDLGYGPPMYSQPDEVDLIAGRLVVTVFDDLRDRFDIPNMAGLNLYGYHGREAVNAEAAEAEWARLVDILYDLETFYENCATADLAVVSWL